ncbi:hypothetical protein BGX33_001088 [Mortierella sp. NVP41]|nr:hypothetical protein BGX33_001088 [Mortierella sp. NVP41]
MDVDTITPIDTIGTHTHPSDPLSTLKDSSQPAPIPSTDSAAPSQPNEAESTTTEAIVQDQQTQQPGEPSVHNKNDIDNSTLTTTAPKQMAIVEQEGDDDGDDDLHRNRHPSAVFRPQLDDIVMDQDLLDFYEQLKFLVSLSPLKTAQVLYAFSLATEHLSPELEVRRSVLDMNRRAFSFYQENTWFTVDLESNEDLSDDEAYESSDPKFRILPARHGLFPALQKQPFGYQPDPGYYTPYPPYPYYHDYPNPYFADTGHYSQPSFGPYSSDPLARPPSPGRQDAEREGERKPRDRERSGRSHRHGKSSKRRRSRESEASVRPSGSVTKIRLRTSGDYDDRSPKKSRRDPESPSLSSMDGVRKHHRRSTETGDANMDLAQRSSGSKDLDRHRDRVRDPEYERQRMERRMARKLKHPDGKHRSSRHGESGDRQKDSGSGQKIRPLKITLVQSGKPPQESAADGAGHETPKSSHGWNPNADQTADGAGGQSGNSASASQRNIQPQNNSSASKDDATSSAHAQKPANINTQAPQPIPRKSKHLLQASPIQPTSANGVQNPQGAQPLSTDKSDDKLKKGTWTAAEEEILLEAVRGLSSENWHAVAQMVPGRNAKQCMQKWQTDLDPQINRLPWTEGEDEKLVEAYHKYGNSWQQIAKMVETRTWYQCYNRVRAKSVKTKIQQTTGTHPASIANGGIPGGPRGDGSKPGPKRDPERRKAHHQGGITSGLASGPSMDPRSQAGPSQPRPVSSNGESSMSNSGGGDYIRRKGHQVPSGLASGPSGHQQGSSMGHRDQPNSSPLQGPPSSTESPVSSSAGGDYHRSSPMNGRQQDMPQGAGPKPAPSTPSQPASQSQFHPPSHMHSPQQPHHQHQQQHQLSPQQRAPQHQPSQHASQQQHQQSLKQVKSEPQQPTTPQPKQEPGYWPKQSSSSSPHPGSPKDYRTPQHSQVQQQQQPSPQLRQHSHAISPAQSHSPSQQPPHHNQQGMQPPPPPSTHSNYPSQSPKPTVIHMTYESQSSKSSSNGSSGPGNKGPSNSGGAGLGIHQSYPSQQQKQQPPSQQKQQQSQQQQQQHSSPYQQPHSSPHQQQHHRSQPSPHQQQQQQQQPQQSPQQQQQQSPHYRQKSSSGPLRPVPPLSASLPVGQSPISAGSSSPSISMQPQHGHRPPMSQKTHSNYSPSTLPPIQQHHVSQQQQQQQQQSPKPFSGSQRLPSFNGPIPSSSSSSSTTSSSTSSPHPLLPPVQAHFSQQQQQQQGQQRQQQAPPTPSPPPPQALGASSSLPYASSQPPPIVTSVKMTPPGPGSHSTYSTPVLAPPLLSPTIANSPTGGFISTSALLMMARQQQQQQQQSPSSHGSNNTPSASIPPP